MGDNHVLASREEVVGSHYSGSHWLASFLFYALDRREALSERLIRCHLRNG